MSCDDPCVKGVVFDLDGTLVDTMPFVLEGLATAVSPYRSRPTPEEVMRNLGGPSGICVERLLGGPLHVAPALAAYLEFLDQHDRAAQPFRGVGTLLEQLQSASVRIGLWTGRERNSTLERLRLMAWEHWFDPVICGDDLPTYKPDPEGLLKILRSWQLAPAQVIFVGDSDQDLAGGNAADVPTVFISNNRPSGIELVRPPLAVVPDPPASYAFVRRKVLGTV
jgi:HAD superfamily hydrolase (TIGR01549 family)